jgi:hypothetical protein
VSVAKTHSQLQLAGKDMCRCLLYQREAGGQLFHIFRGKDAQDPICQLILRIRLLSDSETDTGKGVGTHLLYNASQTALSAVRSACADAHPSGILADVIHQNKNVLRRDPVKIHSGAYSFAGCIHIGERLHQKNSLSVEDGISAESVESGTRYVGSQIGCQAVQRHKAGVVAGLFVFFSGVSETGDDMSGLSGRALFFFGDLLEQVKNICHIILSVSGDAQKAARLMCAGCADRLFCFSFWRFFFYNYITLFWEIKGFFPAGGFKNVNCT